MKNNKDKKTNAGSLARSNALHCELMEKWHSKSNTGENRAYGNYHADCIDQQRAQNRVLSKTERKKLFSWYWNYEVNGKRDKYPL